MPGRLAFVARRGHRSYWAWILALSLVLAMAAPGALTPVGVASSLANAAVMPPDHPSVFAEDPNALASMEPANPTSGVSLVQPPSATSTGDAELSYPIEIPKGRLGMQPSLSLTYSSGSGSSWLGQGWDLSVGMVAVDTRFGAPRYDAAKESETYLLNGARLIPVTGKLVGGRRVQEREFRPLVEGGFSKIVRHGASPQNYWWEVTDKSGKRMSFGAPLDADSGPDGQATLTTACPPPGEPRGVTACSLFRWGLRELRDLHGNAVIFHWAKVKHYGVAEGTEPGYQIYLQSTRYTDRGDEHGQYEVAFERDQRRTDIAIDARSGAKVVTADRLKAIKVTYAGKPVRSYEFTYREEAAYNKTLLAAIEQRDAANNMFHTHAFDYFDDARTEGSYNFGNPKKWITGNDQIDQPTPPITVPEAPTPGGLSGSLTNQTGGHLYVGYAPPFNFTKSSSFGVKGGFSGSTTTDVLALVDLNGDGLVDKVFLSQGVVFYRPQVRAADGAVSYGNPVPLNIKEFGSEASQTLSIGPELYLVAQATGNVAWTWTKGTTYLRDVNADGLVDLVAQGRVLFNHLVDKNTSASCSPAQLRSDWRSSCVPRFDADSRLTPVPISGGSVAPSMLPDSGAEADAAAEGIQRQDTVRRWTAPISGTVSVTGDVALEQADRHGYPADGLRVAIQHNGSELWSTQIGADDFAPKTPNTVDSIPVNAGDRLYFRVQSGQDGAFDQVSWDPKVSYVGMPPQTDANAQSLTSYQSSTDFGLTGRPDGGVQVPLTGTIRLTGGAVKSKATSDDIAIEVVRMHTDDSGKEIPPAEVALHRGMDGDQTGTVALDDEIAVTANDRLYLWVRSDSPIDAQAVSWSPELVYVSAPGKNVLDEKGEPIIRIHPPIAMDVYPEVRPFTTGSFVVPQLKDVTELSLTVAPPSDIPDATGSGFLTVKSDGHLVAKEAVAYRHGHTDAGPLTMTVHPGQTLFFDYSSRTALRPPLFNNFIFPKFVTVKFEVPTPLGPLPVTLTTTAPVHNAQESGLFPPSYRSWAYVGYDGTGNRATHAIDESSFEFQDDQFNKTEDQLRERPDDTKMHAFPFTVSTTTGTWAGPTSCIADTRGSQIAADKCRVSSAWASGTGLSAAPGTMSMDLASVSANSSASGVERRGSAFQAAGGAGLIVTGSLAAGNSGGSLDYLDLNGDGYPDYVGDRQVQYTDRTGAPGTPETPKNADPTPPERIRDNHNAAGTVSVGGNLPQATPNSRGNPDDVRAAPRGNGTGAQMVPLGLAVSGSYGGGETTSTYDLMDVNGDGLADRVRVEGLKGRQILMVGLNLGYSFLKPEPWGVAALADGSTTSMSAGLSVNLFSYGIAGGPSLTWSDATTSATLIDVNGDGLVDRVRNEDAQGRPGLVVGLNTGAGFADYLPWQGVAPSVLSHNQTRGAGLGVYFTIPIPIGPAGTIIINPGGDHSETLGWQSAALRDLDGDGAPDAVTSNDQDQLTVQANPVRRTNLLKSVIRPLGGRIDLDYERVGNTYELPQSRMVLSSARVNDGHPGDGADTVSKRFEYALGVYDRKEREFLGFGHVTTKDMDGQHPLRSTVRDYDTSGIHSKGLLTRERVTDDQGRTFTETANTYKLRDLENGQVVDLGTKVTGSAFPMLLRTDARNYEGSTSAGAQTFTTFDYDGAGNITRTVDGGDTDEADDDVISTLTYSDCPISYLSTATTIVSEARGKTARERRSDVDCSTGDVTQVRAYLANGQAATSDMQYTPDGNLASFTGPPTTSGPGYKLSYQYDSATRSMVTAVTDSFGLNSATDYDPRFGVPTRVQDQAGQVTTFTLDDAGRPIQIVGPYQQGGTTATLEFEYHPLANPPWARTKAIPPTGTDTFDTLVFDDGLGRTIQTKTDSTVLDPATGRTADVRVISGHQDFDALGRAVAASYPTTESLTVPAERFNSAVDPINPRSITFDVLDRPIKVQNPDGAITTTSYGFGKDRDGETRQVTAVTDAEGTTTRSYADGQGQKTALLQTHTLPGGAQQLLWNSASYDPLGQLEWLKDAKGNQTAFTYDNLGRRTSLASPDAGRVDSTYDLASNLIEQVTPTLRDQNLKISYRYDFGRLTSIDYPMNPGINVTYTYGGSTAGLEAGRLIKVTDESGTQTYTHGRLGEVTNETRAISSKTGALPEIYTTTYLKDTFGRLLKMTYPDGESLAYTYDSGGQPTQIDGDKDGWTYRYLSEAAYDKFGQRARLVEGNKVTTNVSFDPVSRRLANINSGLSDKPANQNLKYTYDKIGNVTSVTNDVPVVAPNAFGGPMTQTYAYDDLHRLAKAEGRYLKPPDRGNKYTLTLRYDELNSITSKTQKHDRIDSRGNVVPQQKTTRSWNYVYDAVTPHAPDAIGDRTYAFDQAGQQMGWNSQISGNRRTVTWDEEGHIQTIVDNGAQRTYAYDHTGRRVVKIGPEGETVYVSPSFSIRNREVAQKDIFIGGTRFATKLMKQQKPGSTSTANPYEKDIYYTHADHLGSTEFVTNLNGSAFQHLEYFPSGEAWIREDSTVNRTNYLFTGKELDEETGLYYYGARYYDPQTGQFLSTDPQLETTPGAGMENPQFLALYSYASNNAVNYVDPNGASAVSAWWEANRQTVAEAAAGFSYGALQGLAPGGFLAPSPSPHSRTFEFFRGAGQITAGISEALAGSGGEAAGVALDATVVGAVVGVPLNIASAAVIANGVASITAGVGTLTNSMAMNSSGSGSAGTPPPGPSQQGVTKAADHAMPIGPATEKVSKVLNQVDAKGAPLPGSKGGRVFQNSEGRLPETPGVTYREWDVNPYVKGVNRGPERIVTGSDGSAYWTGDHYETFMRLREPIK
ncbi:RHS repeat-associated core domain-containing protein [Terrabacter sp. GCM10028922]|uniref:RHS repeat-associated core domain-containing protein n=1 Tax=Terrabacter sp. GCM10028922 TaxID=3273428 RepID=UPI00360B83AD